MSTLRSGAHSSSETESARPPHDRIRAPRACAYSSQLIYGIGPGCSELASLHHFVMHTADLVFELPSPGLGPEPRLDHIGLRRGEM
jgi:hypothetical protein